MRRSIGHPIWFGDSDPVKAAMLILADETIIFATLDAIALLWLCLKLLVTHWTDEESFRTWHRSHEYRESHAGIPKGLKLDAAATEVRAFRHIAS